MSVITLISDWHKSDYYSGAIKGFLLSQSKDIELIEITHQIELYKVEQAAFILKSIFHFYPENSIHIIAVGAEPGKKSTGDYIIALHKNRFIIFADNGFAGIFWPDNEDVVFYKIQETEPSSFPELDIMAKAALLIAKKLPIDEFCEPTIQVFRKNPINPSFEPGIIIGAVIYNDSYGNAICNITRSYFEKAVKNAKFMIIPGSSHYPIREISTSYNKVFQSEQMAIFNSLGYLEIAINNGSAKDLLGLKEGTNIRIEIYDT